MIELLYNVRPNFYKNLNKNLIKNVHLIHSTPCKIFITLFSSLTNISSIQNLDMTDDSSFLKSKFTEEF